MLFPVAARDCSSIPSQALRALFLCHSRERMPYQRRCRRDSDACRLEEHSPSLGQDYCPARPRPWRRSRGRGQHQQRPRRYQQHQQQQQHCRRRRSRSCSSASSVSSIRCELRFNCSCLLPAPSAPVSTSIPVAVFVVRFLPSPPMCVVLMAVGFFALIREGAKPCSLGIRESFQWHSRGASAPGQPCSRDSLLPAAGAASGGIWGSIPRFGFVPGSPCRWDWSAWLSRAVFMPCQFSESPTF